MLVIPDEKKQLLHLIKQKREELLRTGEIFGLNSDNTLKCSQELDKLLIKYQRSLQSKS